MVWSRASLVVGVQQHGGLARRLWHSPVAASAAAVAKAAPLHCCGLPRHRLTTPRRLRRNCRAALLHGCTAAPICCAAPAAAVTAYCRTAPPSPLSYGSATAAHCRAASYIAATPRRAAPAAAPRRSAAAASLSCCCPTPPPQPLCDCRAAPLHCRVAPLRAAPRHSATCCQLCTAPPRCCRAASLLPRRFATATPQRVLLSDALEPIAVGLGAFQNMLGIMYCGCMFVASSLLSVYCPLLHRPLRQYGAVRLDSDIMGGAQGVKSVSPS